MKYTRASSYKRIFLDRIEKNKKYKNYEKYKKFYFEFKKLAERYFKEKIEVETDNKISIAYRSTFDRDNIQDNIQENDDVQLKRCWSCKKMKPIPCFVCDSRTIDGRSKNCYDCRTVKREIMRLKNNPNIKLDNNSTNSVSEKITPSSGEKRCGKCGIVKKLDEFYANKQSFDKLSYRCKQCENDYRKMKSKVIYDGDDMIVDPNFNPQYKPRLERTVWNTPTEKKCTKCGIIKKSDEFYVNRQNQDGLAYKCKKCEQIYQKELQIRKKHEKI